MIIEKTRCRLLECCYNIGGWCKRISIDLHVDDDLTISCNTYCQDKDLCGDE